MFSQIDPPVETEHVCHLWRGEAARSASDKGVAPSQLLKGGRWQADGSMNKSYLDSLIPMEFARVAAGHNLQRGFYDLPRNNIFPTEV